MRSAIRCVGPGNTGGAQLPVPSDGAVESGRRVARVKSFSEKIRITSGGCCCM
ncbi:hypothetical protein NDR87_09820 [Nocardia sp. CDC159]|uniref:Uncharacterized protein n=1 Tax=Nocardia pulmonis TaxID=2951408 RepID=A0A9X2E521_9NOCA|nr:MULTISPECIES: hypothetical protein [Nocardia]MCM6773766.1 hypothetical protein [Nocardia pulmonis]MCM6786653.1 hypothetical protein [Nocardia sp. CDC159]